MNFAAVAVANDADLDRARKRRSRSRYRPRRAPSYRPRRAQRDHGPEAGACSSSPPEDEPAVAQGVVELVEPLGSETLALLRVGDALLTGRFPPEVKLKPGRRVPLGLALDHAHLFEADIRPRADRGRLNDDPD